MIILAKYPAPKPLSMFTTDTPLEIMTEGDAILLRKYRPADACVLCGQVSPGSVQLYGKTVCPACQRALAEKEQG